MPEKRVIRIARDSLPKKSKAKRAKKTSPLITPYTWYKFEVKCELYGEPCNPVPYQRANQNTHRKELTRYHDFCDVIRGAFLKNYGKLPHVEETLKQQFLGGKKYQKPLQIPAVKHYLDIMIYFGKGNRGDKDNIAKGVADALFVDDKDVAFNADYLTFNGVTHIFPHPKMIVTITSWDVWLREFSAIPLGNRISLPRICGQRIEYYEQ